MSKQERLHKRGYEDGANGADKRESSAYYLAGYALGRMRYLAYALYA